jgi:regulator of protease activity HflC (stomatin/prohibitin superfamily)
MGLEKLVDVILQFVDLFRFWTIVNEGNVNVIYTLGRITRILYPSKGWFGTGLYFKGPFKIEDDVDVNTREEAEVIANQDLMTSDKRTVRVSGAFRYQVVPEKAGLFLTSLGDEHTARTAYFRASLAETILRKTYEDLMSTDELKDFKQEILERSRAQLNRYGYKIYDFWWVERTSGATFRLITGE